MPGSRSNFVVISIIKGVYTVCIIQYSIVWLKRRLLCTQMKSWPRIMLLKIVVV